MKCPIAIVGMACRYPDADTVGQLFENSLAQRRSFRTIPDVRLSPSGYFDDSGQNKDQSYSRQAAVIKNFEFDRERFRVSRDSYAVTDLTHWLALTVAEETIDDIRFKKRNGPPRETVRVVVGNTLTGEFSRAHLMRLRWPYVAGVVNHHLESLEPALGDGDRQRFLRDLEAGYKQPFAVPNEDFLAGGLANTIAGRVCNHFDFKGGGYTIDGACSSSLLAVTEGCAALASGDADMVLAGGIDLSLDPFELVGFSRTAALARSEMLVYDEKSEGFWPGEGCGFVALMRYEDAIEQCGQIHAVIGGWGISSDGSGGLTRPERVGQMLALDRAYQRAGYGVESVSYFEGHGTGTKVGDTTELGALITSRQRSGRPINPAVISSIKANIGHTKAAAGMAGLLRATKCLAENILPPTTACRNPHPIFAEHENNLMPSDHARPWESDLARRAGISAMGFGGVNTHLTIAEETSSSRRASVAGFDARTASRLNTSQDSELFLFAAENRAELQDTVSHLSSFSAQCSRAEMTDLAVELSRRANSNPSATVRAAVVAAKPAELTNKLEQLAGSIADKTIDVALDAKNGVFFSSRETGGKIGFLFSGQGSPRRAGGGIHARRFDEVQQAYKLADLPPAVENDAAGFAQLAIITASVAGLAMLKRIGVDGDLALGHSLGELSALHWGGCYDGTTLVAITKARAHAIGSAQETDGSMAAVSASYEETRAAMNGTDKASIANINSPRQTVISGPREAVGSLVKKFRRSGLAAVPVSVNHAFHTPAMQAAIPAFRQVLDASPVRPADRSVVSTVTGRPLPETVDISAHLCDQLVSPVQFLDAVNLAARKVDLFIEIGPGEVLTNLTRSFCDTPGISLDVGGGSMAGLLKAAGAAFALGRAPGFAALFEDRFARPFDWNWSPTFFQNPCESNPESSALNPEKRQPSRNATNDLAEPVAPLSKNPGETCRDQLRHIIADRTGLPAAVLQDGARMLSDLHLNSITVGEIVAQASAAGGLLTPVDPTEYADASLAEIADALDHLAQTATDHDPGARTTTQGLDTWIRYFAMSQHPTPIAAANGQRPNGEWQLFGSTSGDPQQSLLRCLNAGRYGTGTICWLSHGHDRSEFSPLLKAAQHATGQGDGTLFVIVQCGSGAGGFAKSFFLEHPSVPTLVINLPAENQAADFANPILREIDAATTGFNEVFLGSAGGRKEARLHMVKPPPTATGTQPYIDADDVILVSGGGRGISAECGFQLAKQTRCALLILGRSKPEESPDLGTNLERLRAADVRVSYQLADVTDPAAVMAAVESGVAELGAPVTGIVHGAGLNHPRLIANMSPQDIEATVRPKVDGLKNLLASTDASRLKLLVTFSSIIARMGLQGEGDYALANEWLGHETEAFQIQNPGCRCRAIEWSVWSGTGMGQRLGRIDALIRQGISPISIDDGVREFLRIVDTPELPTCLIVSGRFGNPPTVKFDRPPVQPLRFLEQVSVFYPDVELVAECQLSPETDPYLDDHVLNSEHLFPAVMALEAMTETATVLAGVTAAATPVFRDVVFRKAVVAPSTLRLTAIADENGTVSIAIRCSSTQFQINHVEARCDFPPPHENQMAECIQGLPSTEIQPFDPARSLYDNVLFQNGRFRRIQGYQAIETRRCCGSLATGDTAKWFSADLPQECLLGDAGARDAALHAIQACIPHKTVIPVAIEQIETGVLDPLQPHQMFAEEIEDRGIELVYDLTILDPQNRVVERWKRITLRVMGEPPEFRLNAPPLAAPFLERRIAELIPEAALRVSITPQPPGQQRGSSPDPEHRPDGKPDPTTDGKFQSSAHSPNWKLTVQGAVPVGCDLEAVQHRDPAAWQALLGAEGIKLAIAIADHAAGTLDVAATRVWTAREAMKKAGINPAAPLTLDPESSDQWVKLASGATVVYSSLIDTPASPESPLCATAALHLEPTTTPTRQESPAPMQNTAPDPEPSKAPAFEYRHIVSFQETNVVGNVYYVNQISWQGRCREMFLKEHCPEVVDELRADLTLATCRCSCEYLQELHAFDEVIIRMRLNSTVDNRIEMIFHYYKSNPGGKEQFVAQGSQEIACMRTVDGKMRAEAIPHGLQRALEKFKG